MKITWKQAGIGLCVCAFLTNLVIAYINDYTWSISSFLFIVAMSILPGLAIFIVRKNKKGR